MRAVKVLSLLFMALGGVVACSSAASNKTHRATTPQNNNGVNSCTSTGCPLPQDHSQSVITDNDNPFIEVQNVAKHCPDGMVYVEGDYCPNVQQTCLYSVDIHGNKIPFAAPVMIKGKLVKWPDRCGEFKSPTTCLSKETVHKTFCIDKYEYPNVQGVVPKAWMSWKDMGKACKSVGKRLCTRSEWTFACEGPDMHPYPYGDGYHRNKNACNFDNLIPEDPVKPVDPKTGKHILIDVFEARHSTDRVAGILNDLLVPSGSKPDCVSPFGVYDMVGNLDESVVNETGHPYKSGLMGGHVFGVRNACRPMTEAHNEDFVWYETGSRCCNDVK